MKSGLRTLPAVPVAVVIVTWNSARWLARCLDALRDQEDADLEVVVVDNASDDGSAATAAAHPVVGLVVRNATNTGFAGGQNQGIAASTAPVVLCLNPDVFLSRRFVATLAPRLGGRTGFATGRLLRADPATGEANGLIDSTGLEFLRNRRHVDRGAGEPDDGRFPDPGPVGGAPGAALLATRAALEDVTPPGHPGPFDESFFAYREDADLAWRARILGWRCIYEPAATALHVRALRPDHRRAHIDPAVNMHSVKNRWLMLVKNETWPSLRPDLGPVLAREALILGGVLLRERSSLPAYPLLARALPHALRDRRWIHRRRTQMGR
jgi:GT2 family glycosyltransferase